MEIEELCLAVRSHTIAFSEFSDNTGVATFALWPIVLVGFTAMIQSFQILLFDIY